MTISDNPPPADALKLETHTPEFRIGCVGSAQETLGRLTPGFRVVMLCKGQFSLLDLVRALVLRTGPVHLQLSTWTTGWRDIEHASWLLRARKDLLSMQLIVDRSFVKLKPNRARRLVELFGADAVREARTHAKFAILRNDDWSVAVRGSGNWNRNRRWEQWDLDDSPEICDFFQGLLTETRAAVPPGVGSPGSLVNDAFETALLEEERRLTEVLAPSEVVRLARLGYTRSEIERRLGTEPDEATLGHLHLQDTMRAATIALAERGDAKAVAQVRRWLDEVDAEPSHD